MSDLYRFQNMIRQEALKALASKTFTSWGIISDYDSVNYLAQVQLYPSEDDGGQALQTGWLPIATPWATYGGSGVYAAPEAGDIVEVHYQEGSLQNGYVCLRIVNSANAPVNVPAGEFWIVHKNGSSIKIKNDGKIIINGNTEIDITAPTINITVSGAANITAASVTVDSADVKIGDTGATLTGLMNDVAISVFNGHVHSGVTNGSDDSGTPTTTLDTTALTQNLTAN